MSGLFDYYVDKPYTFSEAGKEGFHFMQHRQVHSGMLETMLFLEPRHALARIFRKRKDEIEE